MMRIIPKWVTLANNKLQETIDEIVRENDIDWHFAHDSMVIDQARDAITDALERIKGHVYNPLYQSHVKEIEKMQESDDFDRLIEYLQGMIKKRGRPSAQSSHAKALLIEFKKEESASSPKKAFENVCVNYLDKFGASKKDQEVIENIMTGALL